MSDSPQTDVRWRVSAHVAQVPEGDSTYLLALDASAGSAPTALFGTGSYLWSLIDSRGPASVAELSTYAAQEFSGLPIDRARTDIENFVRLLHDHGLIEPA